KNFLRALRYVLPYRRRLFVSILCAVFAAVLWGLNFTAVYPFLKLLTTEQNLQTWIDDTIKHQEQLVDEASKEADRWSEKEELIKGQHESSLKDKQLRDVAAANYKAQS